ncbi:hypothetical protein BGZ65_012083 [Modicella reniformis]|uniref:Uncharacterized protein n=1 Tax=Modicella reniformis TaxID=1440133 RepID=A0A9P6MM39_9FUNG|nr:hypothetical protein BGZ65_012083 [Modicella reniformis]
MSKSQLVDVPMDDESLRLKEDQDQQKSSNLLAFVSQQPAKTRIAVQKWAMLVVETARKMEEKEDVAGSKTTSAPTWLKCAG